MIRTTALRLILLAGFILILIPDGVSQRRKKNTKQPGPEQIRQQVEYTFIEAEKLFLLKNYSQATELLNKCLALDPTNDAVYYKLAEISNNTEQYQTAANYIDKALEQNKDNKYYYLLAVDINTNLGNLKETAGYYERMISQIPGTKSYLFNLAAVLIYLNDLDGALEIYQEAENEFGLNEKIAFQRQKIYLQQNKLNEAINEGKRLMAVYPANKRYALMTAEILSSNGRLDESAGMLSELLEDDPSFSPARLQIADIYWKQKKMEAFDRELKDAFQDPALNLNAKVNAIMKYMVYLPNPGLERLLPDLAEIITTVHPEDGNAYLLAGDMYTTLIDKKLVAESSLESVRKIAAQNYGKFVSIDPSKFSIWQNLINLDLQLDQQDSLDKHADQALELFPNQAWLYLISGVAKHNKKDPKAAAQLLEMGAIRASGNNQLLLAIYGYLGDIYNELKEYHKSDQAYDKVLEIDPLNFSVLNNYSYYLSLRGEKLDKARDMCSTLIKSNPDNTTFLDTYAWVNFNLGNYEEARRVFEKIMQIGVTEGVYHDHFGDTLYKLGLIDDAIVQWKKAKKLDGTIEHIDEKINQGKIIQ